MIGVVVDELRNTADLCCKLAADFKTNPHLSESLYTLGCDLMERAAELDCDFHDNGMR
jgi:hypothetical protein